MLRRLKGELPADFAAKADAWIAACAEKGETIASRKASQNTLNAFGPLLPELLGGSADLAGSNLTLWKGCHGIQEDAAGNYVYSRSYDGWDETCHISVAPEGNVLDRKSVV